MITLSFEYHIDVFTFHIHISECPHYKYGMNCTRTCSCKPDNTVSCDKVDGSCSCQTGWEGKNCHADVKECTINPKRCGANAQCHEAQGSFRCTCNAGYKMNAASECEGMWHDENINTDVKECTINPMIFVTNAQCLESPGSFFCTCNAGYKMDADSKCEGMWNGELL